MGSTWLTMERSAPGGSTPYVARVESVGRRLPDTRLSTAELMATTRHRTRIDLERLTGIGERRVSDEEHSLSLATDAALDALSRSCHAAKDLDVVVNCGITKYRSGFEQWLEPPTSVTVARAIGADNALSLDLSNACAGMLTGLFVVNNWIRQGLVRTALVVSGESISQLGRNAARHVRSILSRELASLTLGDAGAAIVVDRADDGVAGISVAGFTTVSNHSRLCLAYPARRDRGARMFTKSQALQRAAIAVTPRLLGEALDAAGVDIADIDVVIPHQTSARAIRKGMRHVCEQLGGSPRNPAVVTVDRYGNTASTTHTVALVEELGAGRLHAGDRVALVALASGLEIGVVLFTVDEHLARGYGNDD